MAEADHRGSLEGAADGEASSSDAPRVTVHTTCPERVVFTEQGNTDGWIATDHAVDPER
jgi:hypothetical protein